MKPHEYIQRIEQLVASGDDGGALALSTQFHESVAPHLTDAELVHVGGLLEGAAMAIDLAEVDEAGTDGKAGGDASPKRKEPSRVLAG